MEDIKGNICKNICELRKANNLTQAALAEKLSYTDKAVSKWERGESIPDISGLKAIADLFGVTLDFLVSENGAAEIHPEVKIKELKKISLLNHTFITCMSVVAVWLVATLAFFVCNAAGLCNAWLSFVVAVPVSLIVWLVLNSVWFNVRLNYIIVSLLMWVLLASVFLFIFMYGMSLPFIFLVGIPGQLIIIFWSQIKKRDAGE